MPKECSKFGGELGQRRGDFDGLLQQGDHHALGHLRFVFDELGGQAMINDKWLLMSWQHGRQIAGSTPHGKGLLNYDISSQFFITRPIPPIATLHAALFRLGLWLARPTAWLTPALMPHVQSFTHPP